MAIIGLQKGAGKKVESQGKVSEKSVKSQGILIWIMSGNPVITKRAAISQKVATQQPKLN